MNTLERFEAKYTPEPNSGCWLWVASVCRGGYGQFYETGKRSIGAHRWSYEHFVGRIPNDLEIDHLCRVPSCVNPSHLQAVTHRVNVLRGNAASAINAKKTHCIQGHPYVGKNLYLHPSGRRRCRECGRKDALARYHRPKRNELLKAIER